MGSCGGRFGQEEAFGLPDVLPEPEIVEVVREVPVPGPERVEVELPGPERIVEVDRTHVPDRRSLFLLLPTLSIFYPTLYLSYETLRVRQQNLIPPRRENFYHLDLPELGHPC